MRIDTTLTPAALRSALDRMWRLSGEKLHRLRAEYDLGKGAPVFTVDGKYTSRGWTEWTQGFQFGSEILQFDATGETDFLTVGRQQTVKLMSPHLTHVGVHDHGFNNVSTYGNLLRLMNEGRLSEMEWERAFYELAMKVSGAVQACRWTVLPEGGFIHSFNGPHSLFVDTIRSCRALAIAHLLGHVLLGENDRRINLLERLWQHASSTARYNIYYGQGRDAWDVRGRTAHECVFNVTDGRFRSSNSQQGFSGLTTWTRGLAWAICGFAELIELVSILPEIDCEGLGGRSAMMKPLVEAARATADFYLANTAADGIPYWDTGAPGLARLGNYLERPADPFNQHEPVDSSAAAIAAQGLLRLGRYLTATDGEGSSYFQAGLGVLRTLLAPPYLSEETDHHGLLLHSVYHRPNGWDYIPPGHSVPCGESSMWGDYHLREAALLAGRFASNGPYYAFYGAVRSIPHRGSSHP